VQDRAAVSSKMTREKVKIGKSSIGFDTPTCKGKVKPSPTITVWPISRSSNKVRMDHQRS
jgi:hypothetical protein